jgi:hypothetical protein
MIFDFKSIIECINIVIVNYSNIRSVGNQSQLKLELYLKSQINLDYSKNGMVYVS